MNLLKIYKLLIRIQVLKCLGGSRIEIALIRTVATTSSMKQPIDQQLLDSSVQLIARTSVKLQDKFIWMTISSRWMRSTRQRWRRPPTENRLCQTYNLRRFLRMEHILML